MRKFCMVIILVICLICPSVVFADEDTSEETSSVAMTALAEYALSWDGHTEIPYVYGGSGRNLASMEEVSAAGAGLDCSGFVCLVYRHFGLEIPMQSSAIKAAAVQTFTDEAQAVPGDVCWWNGHVAIYLGNGKIVHTNTSRPPTNYPHVSQISGEGANYRFPQAFCRMVTDVADLGTVTEEVEEEVTEEVETVTPYGSIITESDLTGMVMEDFLRAEQKRLTLVDRELLTTAEIANLEAINEYLESQDKVIPWYQVLQSFLGICCIFYGVLLIVAYLLDYSNVFLEISLLSLITLGKLRLLDARELSDIDKRYYTEWRPDRRVVYVTPEMLAARVAILFVLGAVLISGILGDILINVIFASRDILGLD